MGRGGTLTLSPPGSLLGRRGSRRRRDRGRPSTGTHRTPALRRRVSRPTQSPFRSSGNAARNRAAMADGPPSSRHAEAFWPAARVSALVRFSAQESPRVISTARLRTSPPLHLPPIDVVVFNDPLTRSHLAAGFALRCFQRLSVPDADTRQCPGRDNRLTGGRSGTVLSYWCQGRADLNAHNR